jgi:heat shock protein beta
MFWDNFGKYLKVGIIEDNDNKDELAKLVKFWSTKTTGEAQTTSLATYVEGMKANQTQIFYVSGDGKAAAARSPVLEKLRKLDYEVLYLTEPLDELMVQSIDSFDGKRLVDAAQGDLKLPEDENDGEAKEKAEEAKRDLEDVCDWLKESLKSKGVSAVEVSTRLTDSAATLVQGAYGMSPTMQRYMKAQAVASGQEGMLGGMGDMNQVTLEINADHPIITKLKGMVDAKPDDEGTKAFGALLYDVAAIATGYNIEDPAEFASRITVLMSGGGSSAPAPAAKKAKKAKKEKAKKEEKPKEDKPEEVTAEVVEAPKEEKPEEDKPEEVTAEVVE